MKHETLFDHYQRSLSWIKSRMRPEVAEATDEAKMALFHLYQDLRRECEDPLPSLASCMSRDGALSYPPYRFEGQEHAFPCVGILKYRGREYPVYDDDYGMDFFIVVDGKSIEVDSFAGETDWYYELDYIIDEI